MIYVLLVCVTVLLAWVAEQKENKLLLGICILILVLFAGLRGESVGIDTASSYRTYRALMYGHTLTRAEVGYYELSRVLLSVLKSPEMLVLFYSGVIHTFIVLRIWSMRKRASFAFMMFAYLSVFYISTMNIMRQYLAIAVVFFATLLFENIKGVDIKRCIAFVVVVVLASTIHTSALMGLVILLVYLFQARNESKKAKRAALLFFAAAIAATTTIFDHAMVRYGHYFEHPNMDFGIMSIYKLLCWCFIVFMAKCSVCNGVLRISRDRPFCTASDGSLCQMDPIAAKMCLLGILLGMVGMLFPYAERICYYFKIYEILFWGQAVRARKNSWFYRTIILIYLLYILMGELVMNGSGIFPYVTIWG